MDDQITRLRRLRQRAEKINATLIKDLKPYLGARLFRRLPDSNEEGNSTTSCSCLMALATSERGLDAFNDVFGFNDDAKSKERVSEMFQNIVAETWTSSGLPDGNAFSSLLIIRTAGFLSAHRPQIITNALAMSHEFAEKDGSGVAEPFALKMTCNLREVLRRFAADAPHSFSVDKYPPTAAIAYWFADALQKLELTVEKEVWEKIAAWSSRSLIRQISLATSTHDSMRDPIEMAMAACLSKRIKLVSAEKDFVFADETKGAFPTNIELNDAILKFFGSQLPSGIWPKYFPLFNYKQGGAGSNYVFSFELLEIVVDEFGDATLFENDDILKSIERALNWCESNRLAYKHDGHEYSGWNSGGQLETLSQGKPESWATAMVHMFLHRLRSGLSSKINRLVLLKYGARDELLEATSDPWNNLIDSPVQLKDQKIGLKTLLEKELLQKIETKKGISEDDKIIGRRSALLFGPPGTSKTTFVRNAAKKIAWPLVELNPSHFLKHGLENIYSQAEEIFEDLNDLSWAVVFFDEMDALAQRRDVGQLDITSQLLTTSMLPKLSRLHSQGRVLYFMATNHQRNFDPAIKRPRRFDLLICVSPPAWEEKLANLQLFLADEDEIDPIKERLITLIGTDEALVKELNLFTFDDFKSFLEHFDKPLRTTLETMSAKNFKSITNEWSATQITLTQEKVDPNENLSAKEEYEKDIGASRRQ